MGTDGGDHARVRVEEGSDGFACFDANDSPMADAASSGGYATSNVLQCCLAVVVNTIECVALIGCRKRRRKPEKEQEMMMSPFDFSIM